MNNVDMVLKQAKHLGTKGALSEYESFKNHIKEFNLPSDEYTKAIRDLAIILKI